MTGQDIPKIAAFRQNLRDYRVPYLPFGSTLGPAEIEAVTQVISSGETLSGGAWRTRFEDDFRAYVGARHAMSVTSGTVALELAIHLLDLRPGDEVVVTPQTYQATIQPLLQYPEVRVRFCDVKDDTLNLDPESLRKLLNDKTRAVILVHYGGLPAEMDAVMELARERGILVIEDSAHALGSSYHGRRPGSLADIGCFSFHSSKNITTLGEGGMLTFANDDWVDRIERLRGNEADAVFVARDHRFGTSREPLPGALYPGHSYTHDCVALLRHGTNATLSEAAAAVGVAQLRSLPDFVARRRMIAQRLREVLADYPGLVAAVTEPDGVEQSQHLFTFFVRAPERLSRERLIHELAERGVQVPIRYFPLHLTPEWRSRGHRYGECPTAERLWFDEQMNLPCHPGLSDKQVDLLCELLGDALRAALC
ncbi:DegT/DnrJ/EryC1/StrS aminotransferase family protein [Streptomyces sp. SAJ15]|uniref:DegT/DnrJ/EryC1/StrS family aminotransferase n=1 Tax=Streptomyces sp. SAJ15 TaxID=2011095 RepID=UPI001186495D|nr:DegT/DnrJ/EryC1/StrS family aminotransferase [Streptomyces sp. SAJ15]TVL91490.1 aminotransferase DegT [Streptomyces sp. SAJ15]